MNRPRIPSHPTNPPAGPLLPTPYSLLPRLTDHRTIGIQYLTLALVSVILGTLLSLLMRIHLVWPAWPLWFHGPILPEDYLALVTIHGTIMLFFVLTTAPQAGFSNLVLPAQIGARSMAFPVLNAASFWLTALALLTLLSSTFVPGGSAISGWTAYPPLSAVPSAGPGQALGNNVLHKGGDGSPLLWLHLFWFFGHPEVYIAILPGLGLTSMLLANFSHRKVFAYRTMIPTTLLIGFLGILLWGHHMFVAGLNPFASSAFSISTMAIALPASAKVLSWLATIWRAKPRYTTAMLFSLGFVSLFITGGLTGPILAQPILDEYLHNTFFVVAHFHLIMAMPEAFAFSPQP